MCSGGSKLKQELEVIQQKEKKLNLITSSLYEALIVHDTIIHLNPLLIAGWKTL